MASKVSAVINTYNEEENIQRAIESVKWAEEIVVVDDGSYDRTLEILTELKAKNAKIKIFKHKGAGFVEPSRNYAISQALYEWVLILDADEEVPRVLAEKLQDIANKMTHIDFVRLPRKNIIFNHFMRFSGWWPDYNIRFFKKGKVKWVEQIHRPPQAFGQGLDLSAEEEYAILHHHYKSISQFIGRMDKYTNIQANELDKEGYKFKAGDLFEKPFNEFLSRFFANQGYRDGLHGLALSLLQAFSFLIVYLKLWEIDKFKEHEINLQEMENEKEKTVQALGYWMKKTKAPDNFFRNLFKKFKNERC